MKLRLHGTGGTVAVEDVWSNRPLAAQLELAAGPGGAAGRWLR
jgi:hypothetical protein